MSKVGKTILGTTLALLLGGGGAYTGYVAIQKTKLENDNKNLTEIVAVRDKEKEDLTNRLTISLSNQKQTSGLITGTFIAAIEKEVASIGNILSSGEYQITENGFNMVSGDEIVTCPITDIGNNKFEVRYENTLVSTLTPLYDENCYWMETSENIMPANARILLVKQSSSADMVYNAAFNQSDKDRLELNSLRAQITTLTQEKQDLQEQLRIKTEEYNEQLEKANSYASENQTLIEQINQKQTEIDTLNTQIAELQAQIEALTNKKSELESQIEMLTNENTELTRRVKLNDLKGIYQISNSLENLIAQKNTATNQISAKEQELADLEQLETSEENTAKKTTLTEEITQLKEEVNLCQTYFLDEINKILEITNDLVNTDFSIFMGNKVEQFREELSNVSSILSELSSKIELGEIDMGSDDVLSQVCLVRDTSISLILEY